MTKIPIPILIILLLISLQSALASAEAPFASDPAISPDGNEICFIWDNDLWLVPFAGGIPRRITQTPSQEWNP
ncbi:MAG TPA: DPP IV N-terminal domain-containing protein, partial [Candidatus Cloacimonas sp.]|nr:DPP IV N-terminal domain-containing protein [Candidatus Cloacimonas sp.]